MSDLPLQLDLTRPLFLLGLLLLPLLVLFHFRSLSELARWQRRLSLVCRGLIVALMVLSLSGLTLRTRTQEQFVVLAVDCSASIGEPGRQQAERYLAEARTLAGRNRLAVLPFAAAAGHLDPPRLKDAKDLDGEGTDLAAAIEAAAAAMPPDWVPHIVLLSDGNATSGDGLRAAVLAGPPISTIPLKPADDPEVQVAAVNAPEQVREGEPFHVEVVLDANHEDEGTFEVYCGGQRVASERRRLEVGENRFRIPQTLTQQRLAKYTVKNLRGFRDTVWENNSGFALVAVTGKPRVLLIEADPRSARPLERALAAEGIEVDVRPPQAAPDSLEVLQNYELVMLSNVPAKDLSQQQMAMIRAYVQDLGGGFLMLGGDQSFGLGGYYRSVLEEILPVRSDFEKEKEKPSLAMVLVIDRSGSMKDNQKMELAKEAAKGAIELLSPSDSAGVIAFSDRADWVSEVQPCANKAAILDRISRMEAVGGTILSPAMEEAHRVLRETVAKLKHVIILTDGQPNETDRGDFQGLATAMYRDRITVSTVGVGDDADRTLLEDIARAGQGRPYYTADPTSVPQIVAQETVAATKSAISEEAFLPQQARATPVLANIEIEAAPFLLGYVKTRPKPTCELILATERGEPLLAWWRYGLGMSVAFTSDAKGRWAVEWLGWPGYSKFWAQVVRHAMRPSGSRGGSLQVKAQGQRALVLLDAYNLAGQSLNFTEAELTVIDPERRPHKLPMNQTAPGRYLAEFETPDPGAYVLEISQKQDGKLISLQSRGLAVGYSEEHRLRPTNTSLLQTIARLSGGRYDPTPQELFAPFDQTALRPTPLWPYLMMVVAVLFLIDVALRRVDLALLLANARRRFAFASDFERG